MFRVNWPGVVVGALAAYAVGFVWYGLLFNDHWLALAGVHRTRMATPFALGMDFLAVLLSVFGLDWVIRRTGSLGWLGGGRVGLAAALFFGVAVAADDFIYGIKALALAPIDFGYILMWFGLAGAIVGGWQRRAKAPG
jgi:hypothetical protein